MNEREREKERLIELLKQADDECADYICEHENAADRIPWYDFFVKILLDNGAIVPPVEVGQTVWYIRGGYYNSVNKKPCPIEVTEINKKWHGKILDWGFIANGTRYRFSSIGKTVFLTREEAEKALAERREG